MDLSFLSGIGDAIAAFFNSPIVQLGIQAIGIYIVVIWLASAYWAFRDMQSRTANPVLPYLAAALVIGFTPALFLFGILVYRIIRPQERLGEAYERGLAEEALIAEIEQIEHCATCGRKVDEDWIICPTCRARLKRVCPNCSKLVGLDWSLCAWCGRDFERREAVATATVPPRPVRAPAIDATPTAVPEPPAVTPAPRPARAPRPAVAATARTQAVTPARQSAAAPAPAPGASAPRGTTQG
ncbi:MAG: zinc ribbon domain-containing protein [Chloroflexi bacterium]|nr:zinc ribbon domain-containing protein [Chloroflexota bacterium]